jgi:adenosylmethionine-8-amino-7-oxononanoate aminotransferase
METTIQGEGPETVAEIIIEPVMSGVGVAVPPDDYLPAVADLCKQYGILLHVDEVINGFGRTGKLFGHQHYGVKPDIIALAKGISSAYLPMAATVISNRVFQSFVGDAADNRQVNQVNTYGGHPVAAAVAARNIEILLEEKLTERSAENGAYLLDALGHSEGAPPLDRRRSRQGPLRGRRARHRPRDQGGHARRGRSSRSSSAARSAASSSGARAAAATWATPSSWRRPLVLTRPEIDRIVTVLDQTIPEVCGAAA